MKGRTDLNGIGCTLGEKKPDGKWPVVVAKTEEKLTLKEENLKPTATLIMPPEKAAPAAPDRAAPGVRPPSAQMEAMDEVIRRKSVEVGGWSGAVGLACQGRGRGRGHGRGGGRRAGMRRTISIACRSRGGFDRLVCFLAVTVSSERRVEEDLGANAKSRVLSQHSYTPPRIYAHGRETWIISGIAPERLVPAGAALRTATRRRRLAHVPKGPASARPRAPSRGCTRGGTPTARPGRASQSTTRTRSTPARRGAPFARG